MIELKYPKYLRFKIKLIVILLISGIPLQVLGQASEYEVKAAFLKKMTHFIEWPSSADTESGEGTFNIAVIGTNPFGRTLDQFFSETTIQGKPVQIRYLKNAKEIKDEHIVFISSSEKNRLSKILGKIKNKNILSVSDSPNFGKKGVLINFFVENEKVRYEINYDSLQKSNLLISYMLLELARIIGKENASIQ